MVDTEDLRKAVRNFQFRASPSSGTGSSPCTVDDMNRLIDQIAKVLNTFIHELEND